MSAYKQIASVLARIVTNVLLMVSFVLGVGVVAVIMRLMRRCMLRHEGNGSTWESPSGSDKTERMY